MHKHTHIRSSAMLQNNILFLLSLEHHEFLCSSMLTFLSVSLSISRPFPPLLFYPPFCCYPAKNARRFILLSRIFFKNRHTLCDAYNILFAHILVSFYPLHMNNGCTEKYCFALWISTDIIFFCYFPRLRFVCCCLSYFGKHFA